MTVTARDTANTPVIAPACGEDNLTWLVAALTAAGAVLRLLYIGQKSLFIDELSTFAFVRMQWPAFWQLMWHREGNMVVYYLLVRAWLHLGDSQFVGRLLSVIFGAACIPALYLLGKRLFDRRIGLIAATILSISACGVRSSQWMRGYSLLLFLLIISSWLLAGLFERPNTRRALLYALVAGLGVYCHAYALLLIGAQWLSLLLLHPRQLPWKHLLLAGVVLAAIVTPAAFFLSHHDSGQLDWIPPVRPIELYHMLLFWAAGGGKAVGNVVLLFCLFALMFAVFAFRSLFRNHGRSPATWRSGFLFVQLLFPASAAFLFSYIKPVFFYRYLIVSLPAFVLLIAVGIAKWRPSATRNVVLVVAACLSLVAVGMTYRPEEDWQGAMNYLLTTAHEGDLLLFPGHGRIPLNYYLPRMFPAGHRPEFEVADGPVKGAAAAEESHAPQRAWLLIFPNTIDDPQVTTVERALSDHYIQLRERRFKMITVRAYERR